MSMPQFVFKIVFNKLNIYKQYASNVENNLVEINFESIYFVIPFNQIGNGTIKEQGPFKFNYNAMELAEKLRKVPLKIIIKPQDYANDFLGRIDEINCEWPQTLINKLIEQDSLYHSCLFSKDIIHKEKKIGEVSLIVIIRIERNKGSESLSDQLSANICIVEESAKLQNCGKDILYLIDSDTCDEDTLRNSVSSSELCSSKSEDLSELDRVNYKEDIHFCNEQNQMDGNEDCDSYSFGESFPYATNHDDQENALPCADNFRYIIRNSKEEKSFDLVCCSQDKRRSERNQSCQIAQIENIGEQRLNCQICCSKDSYTGICGLKQYNEEEANFMCPKNEKMHTSNQNCMKCKICCITSSCPTACMCSSCKINNQTGQSNQYHPIKYNLETPRKCLYSNIGELQKNDNIRIKCEVCSEKSQYKNMCSCVCRKTDQPIEQDLEKLRNCIDTKHLYLNIDKTQRNDCSRLKSEGFCKKYPCQIVCSCGRRKRESLPMIENDVEEERNCKTTPFLHQNINELEENNGKCEICWKMCTYRNMCSCVWRKKDCTHAEESRYQQILNEFQKHAICNCCCKICRLKRKFLKYIQNNSDSVVISAVSSVGSFCRSSIRSRKPKSSLQLFNDLKKKMRKINKHIQSINEKIDTLCSCEYPIKLQYLPNKNKKRKPKRKKPFKKMCKFNARKKKIHNRKYYYNHGEQYPMNIVGHKDCIKLNPQVPPNMGWMWCNGEESRQGWRPGAIRKPVREIMSHFLEDYPIDNLPSSKMRNKLLCKPVENEEKKPYPNISIKQKKNGEYKITLNSTPKRRCSYKSGKPIQIKLQNDCCIPKKERIICLPSSSSICCKDCCCIRCNSTLEIPTIRYALPKKPDCVCRETQYQESDWNFIQKSRDNRIAENKIQINSKNVKKEFDKPTVSLKVENISESKQLKTEKKDEGKVANDCLKNKKTKKYEAKRVSGKPEPEEEMASKKPELKIKDPRRKRNSLRGSQPKETPRVLMARRLPYKQCQQYNPCTTTQQPYYDNVSSCYSFSQLCQQNISCDTIEAPCESYYNIN